MYIRMLTTDECIYTEDGSPSAQWEYTLVMTDHGVEILAH